MLSVATTLFGILFGLLAGGVWIGISLAITGTLMRWDRSGNWIPKSQVFLLNSSAQWRMLPPVGVVVQSIRSSPSIIKDEGDCQTSEAGLRPAHSIFGRVDAGREGGEEAFRWAIEM